MTTNGINNIEDADMAECDGEKVVTMMDVLQEEQDFEDDANAVLGASDEKNCTYSKGYIKRQAIYACLTCTEAKYDPTKRAGFCLACSLNCHENHELVELYTKRNFRCDCGNPKFNSHPCQFTPNKDDLNEDNKYNQNFSGLYCTCHRPYPDPESAVEDDDMIQCIICEDWLHSSHLDAAVPAIDQYSEMICKACMEKNDFLHDYSHLTVNIEMQDIDVEINGTDIKVTNGDVNPDKLVNGVDDQLTETTEKFIHEMEVDKTQIENKSLTESGENMDNLVTQTPIKEINEKETEVPMEAQNTEEPSQNQCDTNVESKDESNKDTITHVPKLSENMSENNAITTEDKLEDNAMVTEEKLTENTTVTEDNLEENITVTEDNIKENTTVTEDNLKENTTVTEDNLKENITVTEDNIKENTTVTEDNLKENTTVTEDILKENTTVTEENLKENATVSEDNLEEKGNETSEETTKVTDAVESMSELQESKENMEESKENENFDDIKITEDKVELNVEPVKLNEDIKVSDNKNELEHTSENYRDLKVNSLDSCKKQDETVTTTDDIESKINIANDIKDVNEELPNTVNSDLLQDDIINKADGMETDINLSEVVSGPEVNKQDLNGTSTNVNDDEISETKIEEPNDSENKTELSKENKRKLSTDETATTEDHIVKKSKPNEETCIRPKGVKRVHKGATFWPSNLRQKLCTCNECLSMYKDLSVLFLIDPEDTVFAYETLGKERLDGRATQYEKGLEALSSLDRIQQINALTEYNKMKDKLLDFLKSFKDRQEVVKEEDIKAFFAEMKPKREPDGVYFCR